MKKKPKKERIIEVRKVAKKWKIWNEKKEEAKLKDKIKKLVSEQFY